VLRDHVLAVRDLVCSDGESFGIGLRLSAVAARELLENDHLPAFRDWLAENHCHVFTINGFPYGSFHGTRVKERVFQPDWTDPARVEYTKDLFRILATIARKNTGASVSTLPGSHKTFHADESLIRRNLIDLAHWLENLSSETGHDFHLGLEPEPLGHFENTEETIAFFARLHADANDSGIIRRRIGVNYDACHFALQYEDAAASLDAMMASGIRISKIHLSSALAFDPRDPAAVLAILPFDEPVYFHQVIGRDETGNIRRFIDLPDFLSAAPTDLCEARVHFHIPLDAEPAPPLRSTRQHALDVLAWRAENPQACHHYEIETYTWAVLPEHLRRPVEEQIAGEYRWVIAASRQE
jgi:sugar phosphate isomerase/epimerase